MAEPNLYVSANNKAQKVTELYAPVNGKATVINRVYGSVNGKAEIVYDKKKTTNLYGIVYYQSEEDGPIVPLPLANSNELRLLGAGRSGGWSTTINGTVIEGKQIRGFEFGTYKYTKIPDGFLSYCDNLDMPLTIPEYVTDIGVDFLCNSNSFNQMLYFPSVTKIGKGFMWSCGSFDQPITFGVLTAVDDDFMWNCYSFNKPVTFAAPLKRFPYRFMDSCSKFNQYIDASQATEVLSFLSACTSFNQPVDLSSATILGHQFAYRWSSFNQKLVLPETITSVGTMFMDMPYYPIEIEVNCPPPVSDSTDHQTLSTLDWSAPYLKDGIKLTGKYASQWKAQYPDMDGEYHGNVRYYRKLILG